MTDQKLLRLENAQKLAKNEPKKKHWVKLYNPINRQKQRQSHRETKQG